MKTIITLLLITTSTFAYSKSECAQVKDKVFNHVLLGFAGAKKQVPAAIRLSVATCASEIVHAECVLNNVINKDIVKGAINICWME